MLRALSGRFLYVIIANSPIAKYKSQMRITARITEQYSIACTDLPAIPIDRGAIKRLAHGPQDVVAALGELDTRKAMQVLCNELIWLHGNADFWTHLEAGMERLKGLEPDESPLADSVAALLVFQQQAFERAGIGLERSLIPTTLANEAFFSARQMEEPTVQAFKTLREQIIPAAEFVSRAKDGVVKKVLHSIVGMQGARIISGAAMAGASVVVVGTFSSGPLAWWSLKAGYLAMKRSTEGLVKLSRAQNGRDCRLSQTHNLSF